MDLFRLEEFRSIIPATVGMFIIGLLSTAYKGAIINLGKWVWKHCTTTVVLSSSNWAFYVLMNAFEQHNTIIQLRVIKLLSGQHNGDDTISKGIGPGRHLIKFGGYFVIVSLNIPDSQVMYIDEERMTLTLQWFGKRHSVLDDLIKTITISRGSSGKGNISVYTYVKDYWSNVNYIPLRDFNTIFIPKKDIDSLITHLDSFYSNVDWYHKRGIPHRYGVLLYGPPGSGKTSLIKAIATKYEKPVYVLPVDNLDDIERAFSTAYADSIIVIEDIDTAKVTHSRKDSSNKISDDPELSVGQYGRIKLKKSSLANILNTIDGIASKEDRVLIITTNNKDMLDPALLRPGRIDLQLDIGCITQETFDAMIEVFYSQHSKEVFDSETHSTLTCSVLQNEIVANNLTYEQIVAKYCVRNNE